MELYYTNQYVTTTLSKAGGLDASETSGLVLASIDGIETAKPGIALLDYQDPLDTSKAEWITYTTINGTTKELQGVTRAQEGSTGKAHDNGCAIAFPLSKSHINNLNNALSIGGVATNGVTTTLDEDDMASNSATSLATQQSIKAFVSSGTVTMTNKTITFPIINAVTAKGAVTDIAMDGTANTVLSIAADGVSTPTGNANNFSGLIMGTNITNGSTVAILIGGATPAILGQTGGTEWSVTKDNAGTTNVYTESGVIKVQNKESGTCTYHLLFFKTRTQL